MVLHQLISIFSAFLFRLPIGLHMVHRNIHDGTMKKALEHHNGLTVLGFNFRPQDVERPKQAQMQVMPDQFGDIPMAGGVNLSILQFRNALGADVNSARPNEGMGLLTYIIKNYLEKEESKFERKDLVELVSIQIVLFSLAKYSGCLTI